MKLTPYWLDTAPPFTGAAQGSVEGPADVVVVCGKASWFLPFVAAGRRLQDEVR